MCQNVVSKFCAYVMCLSVVVLLALRVVCPVVSSSKCVCFVARLRRDVGAVLKLPIVESVCN